MQSLAKIINQINEAVKIAEVTPLSPEKKLRELTFPIWQQFLKEKGVRLNLQIREELILANGRADTVFNRLILEYKKPHVIRPDNDKNRQLITQVQGYILDLAKKERFSKDRLLGVAFDGNSFLFMRYMGRWLVDEPVSVTEESLELFLKNLEKLTSKAALIPENLIRDFAVGKESRNKIAVDCIKAFYNELNEHGANKNTQEHVFFEQWKIQFAEVHGSLEQKKIDTKVLFNSYGFSKKEQENFDAYAFFFALDSYYALLMKLLSYQVVGYYTLSGLTGLPLSEWDNLPSDDLRKKCQELEEGGIFRSIGIRNFLEGDLFSWYIQAWNDNIYQAVQQIANCLNDYDPETMKIAPDETRDILKKLYQYLMPKQIRHDLGEYYTPDWLAERCLNQANYNGDPKIRALDPACGSGTFLILAIKRAKEFAKKKKIDRYETLKKILFNIQGFDLNPMAVISARTNYLMAIADLLKYKKGEITIPIYLCDSINPPQAKIINKDSFFPVESPYQVKTTVGKFNFSRSTVSRKRIQELANIMEDFVKEERDVDDFIEKVKDSLQLDEKELGNSDHMLKETYSKLIELEKKGLNGVWARIIKNAFAPHFAGKFDVIVGNPPWVNWEALPSGYRDETLPLWVKYGLFSLSGSEGRLGGGKKDISMLMMYVAIDKYLRADGRLCFVITQTLFKSRGAGDGFRSFKLGSQGVPFKITQLDDMVDLQPFEGTTNRTSIVGIWKGKSTSYPVPYLLWKKAIKGAIPIDLTFNEITQRTKRTYLNAQPVDGNITAPWISAKPKALNVIKNIIGKSSYKAIAGICTWLNSIYWGAIRQSSNKNCLFFSNLNDIGKIKVPALEEEIESELVYPLLRGREVNRWKSDSTYHVLVPQDPKKRAGYDINWMRENNPKTLAFLNKFEAILSKRSGYKKYFNNASFYSIYNVSELTFAPYKVVWRYISDYLTCAVISSKQDPILGNKVIVPDTKLMIIPFQEEMAAHYVCALMNSIIPRFIVKSYGIETQIAPHIMANINIPYYEASNQLHNNLANLSMQCHLKAVKNINVQDLEEQIDELSADLWSITPDELKQLKSSFEEIYEKIY